MSRIVRVTLGLLVGAVMSIGFASTAQALPFQLVPGGFKVTPFEAGGVVATQAGAHPQEMTTEFEIVMDESRGRPWVSGGARDVFTKLLPGLLGNPQAVPRCSLAAFNEMIVYEGPDVGCPAASQIGLARTTNVLFGPPGSVGTYPIYLLQPPYGTVASFAFSEDTVPIIVDLSVDTAGDYGVEARSLRSSQGLPISKVDITLWGSPQRSIHDAERYCGNRSYGELPTEPCPVDAPRTPFLTNPTICSGPQTSTLTIDSWEETGRFLTETSTLPGFTGCEALRFPSSFDAEPDSRQASSPTGLATKIELPQGDDPETGLAPSTMKSATVTLPEGMVISASSANGLGACTDAQLGLGTDDPIACPDAAKIGTASVVTPTLDHALAGSVYLRTQASQDPASGEMFRLALVLDDPESGLLFKLPGQVRVDPATGRLTTVFPDNPPLPVSSVELDLKSGPRAPLTTPGRCGTYEITSDLGPWSGGAVSHSSSSFTVDQGCGRGSGFSPTLLAGSQNPVAGAYTPFTLQVSQGDGEQNLSGLAVSLPEGLLAKLAGVPLCPDAAATAGSCPSASAVGHAVVGVGAGPVPVYVPQPGRPSPTVYLAGPYKGAPYSLVAQVPAQAGPFDLGTVTVRNALDVDPTTAQVTAVSDPLPQMVAGVPTPYRDVRIVIDRPGFILNPTSCDPAAVNATLTAGGGQAVSRSSRFQVANCERLKFKPKLALSLSGQTKRTGNPALRAVLTQPKGENANIAKAQVILPRTMFIDQSHVNNPCTRVQFNANACPPKSVLGTATAWSPLLDQPLTGPVYFRSNGGERKLPDLVADLNGQIHVTLVGFIDSVKAGKDGSRVRTRFQEVPDAPVSRFVLQLKGGKRGLIENSVDLCKSPQKAKVMTTGQNGKASDFQQKLGVKCRKKGDKKKH